MTEIPVFSPKLSLFKARLKAAIIVERAEFNANLERYQHLTQRIVARHGGSGLAPTVEEFQAWCEGVELTRQMKIPAQNIF